MPREARSRQSSLLVTMGSDVAGNTATCVTTVTVAHDQQP
jgi:hypothetical protein